MKQSIKRVLQSVFQLEKFKQGQYEVISSVLNGNNTVAVMPTGTGKSLCYQLPAYLMEGTVVIVSPLLSLMQDQVEQLLYYGEKRVVALNSFLTREEKNKILRNLTNYKFIFLSPEMFASQKVIESFKKINISLFVVDEAHCISQWGYDFRPDYMKLGEIRQALNHPLTLALTATATKDVVHDITTSLKLLKWNEFIFSVDRPNIALMVEHHEHDANKEERVIELTTLLENPGIIYFSSKKKIERMVDILKERGFNRVAAYHGDLPQESRILIQQQFIAGDLDVICATSAFGMGINKENVKFIIHYHSPLSIESYLQEIGRAGRNGEQAVAILLYSPYDEHLSRLLIDNELPSEEQIEQIFDFLQNQPSIQNVEQYEEELCERAGFNEVQWRITNDFLQSKNDLTWSKKLEYLKQFVRERTAVKEKKLAQLKQWAETVECRREKLLYFFQEEKKDKVYPCCDNCKFPIDLFEKKELTKFENNPFVWQDYLSSILLASEKNEK